MNPWGSPVPYDSSLCQGGEELVLVVETWHLHVGVANLAGCMGIASGTSEKPVRLSEALGPDGVSGQHDTGIEHLDYVNVGQYILQGFTMNGGVTQSVEGMGDANKPALRLDPACRLLSGESLGGGRVCGGLPEVAKGPQGVKEAESLHNRPVM